MCTIDEKTSEQMKDYVFRWSSWLLLPENDNLILK